MKRTSLLFILLVTFINISFAQSDDKSIKKKMVDSIKMAYLTEASIRQPLLRQGNISFDVVGNANVESKFNGNTIYSGKVNLTRLRSNFNIPIVQWGKNSIVGTVTFVQQHFNAEQDDNPSQPRVPDLSLNKVTVAGTVSYSRVDSLFGRQVIYSGSISGITDDATTIRRVTYIGTILFPIKRTANTSVMVGLAGFIDRYSTIPVIPIITYWHRFESKLELTLDPSAFSLRKPLSKNSWVTLGTGIEQNFTFYGAGEFSFPTDAIQSTLDLKSGLSFEHLFGKKLMIGIRGGAMTNLNSRFYRPGESGNDYFIKNKNGTAPFVNVSVSLLPFLKSIIR